MSNKTKLNEIEAGLIHSYYGTVHVESSLIIKSTMDLMETLNMYKNDEIFFIHNRIQGRIFLWNKFNLESQLIEQLYNIIYDEKKYVSSVELRKFKIDIAELPEKLEQEVKTFYNKLIEIGTDVKAIETSKTEVLKSIKNLYFLVDRIKEVIESKV